MAQSIYHLNRLYQEALRDIADSPQRYLAFLESASRNYRYPFQDQVLIHHQRPEATAVLEFDQWNALFHRRIHRGAQGIGVFGRRNGRTVVKYYFDMADTYETAASKPVPMWNLNPDDHPAVLQLLRQNYLTSSSVLSVALAEAAANSAGAVISGNPEMFPEEDLPVTVAELQELAEHSIAYMLLSRLDLNPSDALTEPDFLSLSYLDAPEQLNLLGQVVSLCAGSILTEVAKIVRSRTLDSPKFFAESRETVYDDATTEEIQNLNTGGHDHGNELSDGERLSAAEPDTPGGTDRDRQVRHAPGDLPTGTEANLIPEPADQRNFEPAPDGDSGDRRQDADRNDVPSPEGGWTDGGTEEPKPDRVGRPDE